MFVFTLFISLTAFADESCKASMGWGAECPFHLQFISKQNFSFKGKIKDLVLFTPSAAAAPGYLLKLEFNNKVKDIVLGPQWFIDRQDTRIRKDELVEVAGRDGEYEGKPQLRALSIRRQNGNLNLAGKKGRPVWSAWSQ